MVHQLLFVCIVLSRVNDGPPLVDGRPVLSHGMLFIVFFHPIFNAILFAEKAVELERQNFEVTSALALKDAEIQRLREELEAATQVTMDHLTVVGTMYCLIVKDER